MHAKRFSELTKEEKLVLDGEAIHDAIKLEAIHQGIKIPVTLGEILNSSGYKGFQIPPDAAVFYEVTIPQEYGNSKGCGLAFRTESEARAALSGGFAICRDYGDKNPKLVHGELSYRASHVGISVSKSFQAIVEEYTQDEDDLKFEELTNSTMDEIRRLRQADYDAAVLAKRSAEYLRLAGGNEEVAKGFWQMSESKPWPSA